MRTFLPVVFLVWATQFAPAAPRLVEQNVPSKYLEGGRLVRIYLPESYDSAPQRHYPVLYLHDGQNVFSDVGTNVCFGWGNWELDRAADSLARQKRIPELILVAIDNSPARYEEYCGRHSTNNASSRTAFENYSDFLIKELKPKIDAEYRTLPDAANTAVMGSSMGGICSVVLGWEHPEIFGRAASLSGAFMVEGTNFLNHVLTPYHGAEKNCRFYLDSGTIDYTGGDDGRRLTEAVAGQLKRIAPAGELMHYVDARPLNETELEKSGLRRDKWKEAQTSQHNEFYWRLRVWRPLVFLFPL